MVRWSARGLPVHSGSQFSVIDRKRLPHCYLGARVPQGVGIIRFGGCELKDGFDRIPFADRQGSPQSVSNFGGWSESQAMVDRGRKILRFHPSVERKGALAIGSTINGTSADTSSSERAAEDMPPMVASAAGVDLWGTPKFTHPNDEGFVEESPLV